MLRRDDEHNHNKNDQFFKNTIFLCLRTNVGMMPFSSCIISSKKSIYKNMYNVIYII